jgi:hypothetical protein
MFNGINITPDKTEILVSDIAFKNIKVFKRNSSGHLAATGEIELFHAFDNIEYHP